MCDRRIVRECVSIWFGSPAVEDYTRLLILGLDAVGQTA